MDCDSPFLSIYCSFCFSIHATYILCHIIVRYMKQSTQDTRMSLDSTMFSASVEE
jgi:hypothetical protein